MPLVGRDMPCVKTFSDDAGSTSPLSHMDQSCSLHNDETQSLRPCSVRVWWKTGSWQHHRTLRRSMVCGYQDDGSRHAIISPLFMLFRSMVSVRNRDSCRPSSHGGVFHGEAKQQGSKSSECLQFIVHPSRAKDCSNRFHDSELYKVPPVIIAIFSRQLNDDTLASKRSSRHTPSSTSSSIWQDSPQAMPSRPVR